MLTVPVPELEYQAAVPGVATLERPLTVAVGPVLGDVGALGPADLKTFALMTYRQLTTGALTEEWADGQQRWMPEGEAGSEALTEQLAFKDGETNPWQGLVIAGGTTDQVGAPKFGKAAGGYPAYWFRALFSTADEVAVSGPSTSVTFAAAADHNLLVLGPGEDEMAENATQARVLLKDPSLQVLGGLVIRRDSPGASVTLSNLAGASVVLLPDGSIELRPAPGRGVRIGADLEAERIVYQPAGGGAKRTLV